MLLTWHVLAQERNKLRNTATGNVHHELRMNLNQEHGGHVQSHCRVGLLSQLFSQRLAMVEDQLPGNNKERTQGEVDLMPRFSISVSVVHRLTQVEDAKRQHKKKNFPPNRNSRNTMTIALPFFLLVRFAQVYVEMSRTADSVKMCKELVHSLQQNAFHQSYVTSRIIVYHQVTIRNKSAQSNSKRRKCVLYTEYRRDGGNKVTASEFKNTKHRQHP